ncbi:MAG: carbon-nitrogen hydrolase family protein [Erysipelotrichaceae bacterium]|nr:carbon-nitrogen hydrolase family protein [Erysipelotrichaceae bacterium]
MNIALVSYEFINNDLSFNIKQIEKAFRAVSDKADLLCFGETFLQGFDALSWNYDRDKKIALSQDSRIIQNLRALTVQYGTDLLFGYLELFEDRIYSSCMLIEKREIVHNYRRITKGWKDTEFADEHYAEGTDTAPFAYQGKEMQIALCGDLWDEPKRFRTDGLLLWPVYVNFSQEEWQNEIKEYALQAKKVAKDTVMVNSLSRDRDPVSVGGAFVFGDGELMNEPIYDVENILIIGYNDLPDYRNKEAIIEE